MIRLRPYVLVFTSFSWSSRKVELVAVKAQRWRNDKAVVCKIRLGLENEFQDWFVIENLFKLYG